MGSTILDDIGIDAGYIIVFLLVIQLILFFMLLSVNMKYNRLKVSYSSFMRGKDGKTLEESILTKFEELDEIAETAKENKENIDKILNKIKTNYQKVGIVKYDAFHEMGGNLSFALTMLNEDNSGWIMNAMHSREGCYNYIKEIVNGQSFIELAEEESESLDRAIYQEAYDLREK